MNPTPLEDPAPQTLFARRRLRVVFLMFVAVATVLLAYRLREALNPLLISLILAYVLNPVVRFLEGHNRMGRTAAILLIYAGGLMLVAGASVYSVRQSAVGLDKLMTKITGGWQIVPSPAKRPAAILDGASSPSATAIAEEVAVTVPSGGEPGEGAPLASSATAAPVADTPSAIVSLGAAAIAAIAGRHSSEAPHAATGSAEERLQRIAGLPVYGDGDIVRMGQSPVLGFLDVNQSGICDPSEPEFTRESGRWQPTPRFATIVRRVPGYLDEIRGKVEEHLPAHADRSNVRQLADQIQSASASLAAAGAAVWGWITENLLGGIARIVLYAVLVPMYTFFLLRGFDDIVRRVRGLLPGLHRARIESICARIDRALAAFFRGRLLVCAAKGALVAVGLALLGVDFAVTIGLVTAVLSLIPAVAPVVALGLAVVCSYGPDGGWTTRIVGSGVVIFLSEVAEGVANPVVLGKEAGLHPVTLLVSIFLFGDLFGLFGVLLAVPLAATTKILCTEFVLPELQHLAAEQPGTEVSGFWVAPRFPLSEREGTRPPSPPE